MSGTNTPLALAAAAALALVGAGGYFAFGRSPVEAPPAAQAAHATPATPAVAETETVVQPEPEVEAAAPPVAPATPVERPATAAARPAARPPAPARPQSTARSQAPARSDAPAARPSQPSSRTLPAPAPAQSPVPVARDDARSAPAPADTAREASRQESAPDSTRSDGSRDLPRSASSPVEAARDRATDTRDERRTAQAPAAQEFIVPADSVIGLELEDAVSSETAKVEQRVQGRVTRDVRVNGTVVIPAGTRAQGSVTLVEDGGRFKERARLGIRFHTLVLDGGSTVPIQTETIYREGNDVAKGSAARIGGSAVGGAIIGAIFGGSKGAAIGAAAGAGAGTAATMAGQKSHATLNAGTRLTARLSGPAAVTVEAPSQP